MKVGIIGTGNMGRSIGIRLAQIGHDVFFGARRRQEAEHAAALARDRARAGSNDEAAAFGELLFWTMRETDPASVLSRPSLLDGRIVVDVNNRPFKGLGDPSPWFEMSIAEQLQANIPSARLVKAFSTIAMFTFDTNADELRRARAQTFVAGNDADAKTIFAGLAAEMGFEVVDVGAGPVAFRAVEALGDVTRLLMSNGSYGARAHLALILLPEPGLGAIGERRPSRYIAGSVLEVPGEHH